MFATLQKLSFKGILTLLSIDSMMKTSDLSEKYKEYDNLKSKNPEITDEDFLLVTTLIWSLCDTFLGTSITPTRN